MKAFLSWASSVVFVLVLIAVLYAYAHKHFAGFPDEPEKNVALVPSAAPPGDVALVLGPPMATRQIQGQSQELALQFSNRSKLPVQLLRTRVEPQKCFILEPPASAEPILQPRETTLQIYQLQFPKLDKCIREIPAIFIYSWKPIPTPAKGPSPRSSRTTRRSRRNRTVTPPAIQPATQERFITTTPVRITNEGVYYNERFVRIGQIVLLPVILAILTFIFQRLQAARDEAQSEQNLRIEVWKTIHPTFLSMVKTYYAPLVRRMVAITGLIEANGTPEDLFVLLLLLRRQMLLLLDKDAGYYFQSKPGEDICGILNDALVGLYRARLDRDFDLYALLLQGNETPENARQVLVAGAVDITVKSDLLFASNKDYPAPFELVDQALKLFVTVLAFESDRPFDSVWYDANFAPKIRFASLDADLGSLQKADHAEIRKALNEYRTSIPWRCVSDKSRKIWLQSILLRIPLLRSLAY